MSALNLRLLAELRAALTRREGQLVVELSQRRQSATEETFEHGAGEVPDSGDASVADVAVDSRSAEGAREAWELAPRLRFCPRNPGIGAPPTVTCQPQPVRD